MGFLANAKSQLSKSERKDINFENVGAAMKLVHENGDKDFAEISKLLRKNGFTWTTDDAKKFAEVQRRAGMDVPKLGEGLSSGDLVTGVSFIANCNTADGWSYCREWIFDDGDVCTGSWLKAHDAIENLHGLPKTRSFDLEDSLIVTPDFAKQHGLKEGDMVSDIHGNTGRISSIIDLSEDVDVAIQPSFSGSRFADKGNAAKSAGESRLEKFGNPAGDLIITDEPASDKTHFYGD